MPGAKTRNRHPLESIVYLFILAFAGAMIFTVLGVLFCSFIYKINILDLQNALQGDNSTGLLKAIQLFSTIGTFILPALVFSRIESASSFTYLKLQSPKPLLCVLAVVVIFTSFPVLEYTIFLNQQMKLPSVFREIEEWMRLKEDEMGDLTKKLLSMKTPADLALNLLMIAILPAIGEEFIFRGCLQQVLVRWVKNYHVAVWITAFIFSAIHFQFYGFLPRLLLGALLGYLFVWGKSIWLPVLAHFTNNAVSVVAAYVYQMKGESLDKLDELQPGGWLLYLSSLVLTLSIVWMFYKTSLFKNHDEGIEEY